ncbi:hypothetical protein CFP65_6245 [Kitasatospora sp. MMS16-BH015]|uniref:DUF6230 family protein n=1 Tax=Kitasatospora sp. MMS16-BH015 TaxID=2018025 RepID=UPI000CA16338|nr:DUF6230 family protein [Kitasatospora sp. MMS16-BH015]AUG80909.1 hypothetical protein CFP65_6245 [Kitasatospora sp. MMS16-BH015]
MKIRQSTRPWRARRLTAAARTAATEVATAAGSAAAGWNRRMLEEAADGTRRGTRWGRSAAVLLPAALGIGALGSSMATGVLAASFNVTNTPFTLMSNGVSGTGFGAVLNTPTIESSTGTTSNSTAMARVGFASANLAGLCGIVHQSIAGVGYSLLLTAGQQVTATPPATFTTDLNASNLYIEAPSLTASGSTTLQNAVLGMAADQVMVADSPLTGAQAGGFGLGSAGSGPGGSTVNLAGLNATANTAEIAGSLTLQSLSIRVVPGSATTC